MPKVGAFVDDAGIRMDVRLEEMEVAVDWLLHRVLVREIKEIALGAFVIGVLLCTAVVNMDGTMTVLGGGGGISLVNILPWIVRGLWLGLLPLVLPDIGRTTGAAMGAKEPMRSFAAIAASCALSVPLWLAAGEMVFIAILMDMAGDALR